MPLGLALTAAGLRITSRDRTASVAIEPPPPPPVLATETGESLVTELGERLAVEPGP
jgi:hypothetical protein